MKGAILAAGEGSRLRPVAGGTPKPLYRLFGLTLLERAAWCLRAAGCDELVVVTGHASDQVRSRLERALGEGARWVRADGWRRGNGASLLAAAPLLRGEPFLLVMADHVMDPEVARRAAEAARARWAELGEGAALLLVDGRLEDVFDLDEATRVRRRGERIEAIGKGLEAFDGVDAGVFVGSDGLLDALAAIDRESGGGEVTLTAAAARLAERGRLLAVPLERGWWVDVDDAPAARAAAARLLAHATASGGDGPVARHLNRPLSRLVTRALGGTRATPDAVTAIAFLLMGLAAAAFAAGHPALGGVLVQLSSVIDGVDGELARLRLAQRPAGAFLDTVLDRYADAVLVAGLMAGALAPDAPGWGLASAAPAAVWWAGLAALAGMPLSALMKDRLRLLGQVEASRRYDPLADDPAWLRWIPANRDGRCFVVFVCGLLAVPWVALVLLAALTHALALGRLAWGYRALQARRAP